MQHVVSVESSGNPYAIGVVGAKLQRQPKNLPEAVATAKMLEQKGYNFSLGIAQVNRYNLSKYGLKSYEHAFQVCPNLHAGSHILRECFERSKDWGKSFSCYYSGNFVTGFRHGYVQKIFNSMRKNAFSLPYPANGSQAIPLVTNSFNRTQQTSVYKQKNIVDATTNSSPSVIIKNASDSTNKAPTAQKINSNAYVRKRKENHANNSLPPPAQAQLTNQAPMEAVKTQTNTDNAFVF
ncbi:MAG: transglycosylase SLT domain-containing protein [Neisseria sp.]|uniref:lytic transglycosylase domain-containing protein n=1 Tax=Neisseria sp. TaxID=192066 RepID=UPI0026DC2A42|nr:transglycosylase SLT domain-containing protein [Neisseria sp.]MDO4640698.1 transglycosylase SLT domain-containing protein [Neisseria sp.]